jgi:hypothetical protein
LAHTRCSAGCSGASYLLLSAPLPSIRRLSAAERRPFIPVIAFPQVYLFILKLSREKIIFEKYNYNIFPCACKYFGPLHGLVPARANSDPFPPRACPVQRKITRNSRRFSFSKPVSYSGEFPRHSQLTQTGRQDKSLEIRVDSLSPSQSPTPANFRDIHS